MSTPTPGNAQATRPGRLDGWKEIAAYLGRGVRTVQRWEKALGLPVRRLGTGKGEVVYALSRELDAWRDAAERTRDLTETPGDLEPEDGESAATTAPDGPVERVTTRPATTAGAAPAGTADAAPRPLPAGRYRSLPWLGAAWVLALACLALAGYIAWQARAAAPGQPADYFVDVDRLHVLDAKGRELWSDRLPAPAVKESYAGLQRRLHRDPVRIEDLDGDGRREVFVGYASQGDGVPSEVRGYGASGKRLFTHRLDATVRFGDTAYTPPWQVYRLFTTGAPGAGRWFWVVWIHASGEFPCLLQRLSLDGTVAAETWSAGYIEMVSLEDVEGRPRVLVGAANNDHRAGSLAVFDADAVAGSMPAETWDKTCRTCPPGGPRKVLVFPRLDVLQLVQGFPAVTDVRRQATGDFRVYVDHGSVLIQSDLPLGGIVAYDVSADLTPTLAEFSDDYRAAHDRHARAGLLDHPFGDTDRAAAWPVLVHENGKWRAVTGKTDR